MVNKLLYNNGLAAFSPALFCEFICLAKASKRRIGITGNDFLSEESGHKMMFVPRLIGRFIERAEAKRVLYFIQFALTLDVDGIEQVWSK